MNPQREDAATPLEDCIFYWHQAGRHKSAVHANIEDVPSRVKYECDGTQFYCD